MSRIVVNGGNTLNGEIYIHGAKNSALPIVAAALCCRGKTVLKNAPQLSDVAVAVRILQQLGCSVSRYEDCIEINADNADGCCIPDELMCEMRSSIIFLGAILARNGRAQLSQPGGCELGPRPIDIHISSLKRLGVAVDERYGELNCTAQRRLRGCMLNLPFPSVGATENIIIAAATAQGVTEIHNAAREPEIIDLAAFINACGGCVCGAGESVITIRGVEQLHGCTHSIIPDRIEAATYMTAAAMTGGSLTIQRCVPEHIQPVFYAFREAGCLISAKNDTLQITAPRQLCCIKSVRTLVYPGFPTDALAAVMAMSSIADGTSIFIETIFENRYKMVGELQRMGAAIKTDGRIAVVEGVPRLYGAGVCATDLRGGAALVIAALAATGVSSISSVYHIDRGYEDFVGSLRRLGADIKREDNTVEKEKIRQEA